MANVPFSWMYRDPALIVDQLMGMRERMAKAEAEIKEQDRRRKARKIRKLTRMAKARQLKGQS